MKFFNKSKKNIISISKWIVIGILIGVIGGLLGTIFHVSLDSVTELREHNPYMILFLPLGGIVIAAMYNKFRSKGNINIKRIFESINGDKDIPIVMLPLIFLGTLITHMLGGSAGREGAALQLGGSMGYSLGKAFKQDKNNTNLIVCAGMSSVFSALFGTPFTATVFSLEVTGLGVLNYQGLLIGTVSSIVAFLISNFLGVVPVRFDIPLDFGYQFDVIIKVVILAILCAFVCVVFAIAIHKTEFIMEKYIKNSYVRAMIGGFIIVILTIVLKTTDYNGAGMHVIERAILGEVVYCAFLLKILFTAITVASGFKGGEIVPTFFIGATFGCLVSKIMGLNAGFGASLGLIALFAGMTKCPIASLLLATEVFGIKALPFFAVVIIIAHKLSGHYGLYKNGKEEVSK